MKKKIEFNLYCSFFYRKILTVRFTFDLNISSVVQFKIYYSETLNYIQYSVYRIFFASRKLDRLFSQPSVK